MDAEERAKERNEIRLDQHGERLAKLEQATKDFKETVMREADATRAEMRTYFKPFSEKTASMSKELITLKTDMDWIRPWVRRLLYGGSGVTIIAVVYELAKANG